MNPLRQDKIGEFILSCRKEKGMTQVELANKLYVSDRTISKWERGKGMPDTSIMLSLCEELGITVNELLLGKKLPKKDYNVATESNLLILQKEKEDSDKKLLVVEIITGTAITIACIVMIFAGIFATENLVWRISLLVVALFILIIGIAGLLFIEQRVGYYECQKCKKKFIPTYKQVLFSLHSGRTRKLKCPACYQKSWCKKVIKK